MVLVFGGDGVALDFGVDDDVGLVLPFAVGEADID